MIDAISAANFEHRLKSVETFLKPVLEEKESLPKPILNRMLALAETILQRVQENKTGEESGG